MCGLDYFTSVAKEEKTAAQLDSEDSVDVNKELVGSEVKEENDEEKGHCHNGQMQESIESNSEPGVCKVPEPITERRYPEQPYLFDVRTASAK